MLEKSSPIVVYSQILGQSFSMLFQNFTVKNLMQIKMGSLMTKITATIHRKGSQYTLTDVVTVNAMMTRMELAMLMMIVKIHRWENL